MGQTARPPDLDAAGRPVGAPPPDLPGRPPDLPADFSASNETDAAGNTVAAEPSLWEQANTPLLPQIREAAHAIANYMDAPRQGDAALNERLPGLGTLSAMVRGAGAGMVEGAGDMAASLTSPVGLVMTLAQLGPESAIVKRLPMLKGIFTLPSMQRLQQALQVGGGATFAAHGVQQAVTAPTVAGKVQGVAEAAGGVLGATSGVQQARGAPAAPSRAARDAAAQDAAAAAWGRQQPGLREVVDAGTATGNRFVQGAQFMADRTLGGSLVAKGAHEQMVGALADKADQLATEVRGSAVSPEEAGTGTREALTSKEAAHTALADASYDALRAVEADPRYQVTVPRPPAPVDKLPPALVRELRRIVHELDGSGYQAGRLVRDSLETGDSHYVPRSGGAAVYHDIVGPSQSVTRAILQEQLEAFLGGGKQTAAVKAALGVAKDRHLGRTRDISTPEMPIDVGNDLTRLEKGRVTSDEMGLPVDTRAAKVDLRPVYEEMMASLAPAQQQQSAALHAIKAILDGPDVSPLSRVDRALSAIKDLARKKGGLAKLAASKLDRAVQEAAALGGPEVEQALHQGRQATIAKVQTGELVKALPGGPLQEPTAIVKRATAPEDGGIAFLRQLKTQTPQAVPQIARALLDDLLAMAPDKAAAEWFKRGRQTKAILYPAPGQAQTLDHFFSLQKQLHKNVNPSGSGPAAMQVGEIVHAVASPMTALVSEITAAGVAKILHSRRGATALTALLRTERVPTARTPTAPAVHQQRARVAAWAEVVAAGRAVGVPVPIALPRAADSSESTDPPGSTR